MSEKHSNRVLKYRLPILRKPFARLFSPIIIILAVVGALVYISGPSVSDKPPSSSAPVEAIATGGNPLRSLESEPLVAKLESGDAGKLAPTPEKEKHSQPARIPVNEIPQQAAVESVNQAEVEQGEQLSEEPVKQQAPPEMAEVAGKPVDDQEPKGVRYHKIGFSGEKLPPEAEGWACVQDEDNGLVWEVKSAGGLHDKNSLYTWYVPSEKGEAAGVADGGRCEGGIECDSHAFVQAINAERLCGYTDWRLPTREEMMTLVVMGTEGAATMNPDYFPQGLGSWYWTASSNQKHPEYAWYLLFRNGITLSDNKARAKHLRLVRSATPTG